MPKIKAFIPDEHIRRTIIAQKQAIIRIPVRNQPILDPSTQMWTMSNSLGKCSWPNGNEPIYASLGGALDKLAHHHVGDIWFLPEPYRRAYLYVDQYAAKKVCCDNIYPGVFYETDKATYYPNDPRPLDPDFFACQEMTANKPFAKSAESMPVELARHFVKVTNVRIERLHRINFDDMCFDVIGLTPAEWNNAMCNGMSPTTIYECHWNDFVCGPFITKIYGDNAVTTLGWDKNPWVWCIEIERIERSEALNGSAQP